MDLNFEQQLAAHNQEFADAEIFDNWMPPDGEYVVSLLKLSSDSSTKDGVDFMWWRLTGRIEDVQDEQLNGKEFSAGYFTSKAYGILKRAVKILNGEIIQNLTEAHLALEAAIGTVIRVKIETRPGKGANAGRDFTNCYIQEVLDTTTDDATSAEVGSDVENPAPIEGTNADGTAQEVPTEAPTQEFIPAADASPPEAPPE